MICSREGGQPMGRVATERVRLDFGLIQFLRADGRTEESRMEFFSAPLCRMHAVELILATSSATGRVPDVVPVDHEDIVAGERRLFGEWGL